jgi:hypothetical protein
VRSRKLATRSLGSRSGPPSGRNEAGAAAVRGGRTNGARTIAGSQSGLTSVCIEAGLSVFVSSLREPWVIEGQLLGYNDV